MKLMSTRIRPFLLAFYRSFFVILIYVLILQSMYLYPKFISTFTTKMRIASSASFWFSTIMTVWCHVKCLIKSPGVLRESEFPRIDIRKLEDRENMCMKCNLLKIKRSHHCSICNRCIIKMDHHCIWINGCVGLYNQKFFILLNFYTFLMCITCEFILMYKIIACIKMQPQFKSAGMCVITKTEVVLIIMNAFSSLVFGIFSFVMLVDQYFAIKTNTTGIEYLKNQRGEIKPFGHSLVDVFGHPFSYLWFLPIDGYPTTDFSERKNLNA
ncbi:palmitoyltransferase [Plasmodium gonderi]|uniref:Palmitoyltransferase n=1 Tax=Plasmodium gonderi TaxID=77519 RepID=A0A1Y1JAB5_PLAGO|nr:palmitoyltransferase [Plasmodium gonderi]GAW79451.1 palmitoyltransferase [Plasmodium gonderi]